MIAGFLEICNLYVYDNPGSANGSFTSPENFKISKNIFFY